MEQAIREPGFEELEWTLVLGSGHLSLGGVIQLGFPKKRWKKEKKHCFTHLLDSCPICSPPGPGAKLRPSLALS